MSFFKKVISLLCAVAFLSLTGCTDSGEDIPEPSPSAAEDTVSLYRTDRDVRMDYQSIEISGEHDVRILFINAGRADSILVEADGLYYLIDTGETTSVPKINASLEWMGADKIEAVFLTHSNSDHISGLPMLSELWEIGACYTAAIATEMTKMQNVITKASLEQTLLDPGEVIQISDGLYFEVLGPIKYNPLDENDNSLVLRMTANGTTVLFAGDMQYDEEKTLMRAGFDLRCDILKVGNHGNKDATSVSFMEATSPEYAVITTDRDADRETAHKSVQQGLEDVGAEVLITDEYDLGLLCDIAHDGEITMETAETEVLSEDVKFVSISKADQTAVIKNTGSEDVDLSRWFLLSDRGGEIFLFPDGTVLAGGAEMVIACPEYKGEADLTWPDARVWNKNKDDSGLLVDRNGHTIDKMESE